MLIKAIVEKLDDIFFMAKFFWYLDIDLETIKKATISRLRENSHIDYQSIILLRLIISTLITP